MPDKAETCRPILNTVQALALSAPWPRQTRPGGWPAGPGERNDLSLLIFSCLAPRLLARARVVLGEKLRALLKNLAGPGDFWFDGLAESDNCT